MSQEKTIKISPELFSLKSNKNKTLKNKGKEKKPDIKINNAVKSKLIEKVKEFQKKNKQEAIEKKNTNQNLGSNNNSIMTDKEYNEFEDSLNFLKILSDKNEKKKEKKHNKTLKSPNESNVFVHTELPNELQEISQNISKDNLENMKFDNEKPYGCLKNGSKPTYRQWMKNTQKNKIHKELEQFTINKETISMENKAKSLDNQIKVSPPKNDIKLESLSDLTKINQEKSNFDKPKFELENKDKINDIKIQELEISTHPDSKIDNDQLNTNDNTNDNIKNISNNDNLNFEKKIQNSDTVVRLLEKQFDNENVPLQNTKQENSVINTKLKNNNSEINNEEVNYDEFKINLHRNTKTLKYKLGKRNNKIGILVKNNKTLKRIKEDSTNLKKKSILEVKQYLRKHNLIKVGCDAPNDVLRKMYESAMLSGEINNINSENLLHNFLSSNEEL